MTGKFPKMQITDVKGIPPQPSDSETESDSNPEENVPLSKSSKKYRQKRETSEDEEDIP